MCGAIRPSLMLHRTTAPTALWLQLTLGACEHLRYLPFESPINARVPARYARVNSTLQKVHMNNPIPTNALPFVAGHNTYAMRTEVAKDFTQQLPPCCETLSNQQCQLLSELVGSTRNRLEDADEVPTYSYLGFEFETLTLPANFLELPEPVRQDVCRVSSKSDPDFLLITSCDWLVPGKSASQRTRLKKKYGSIDAVPNAVYVVMFVVETRAGRCVAVANLFRDTLPTRRRIFTPVRNWTNLPPSNSRVMDGVVTMARLGKL